MPLSIKDPEVERLAREQARQYGVSITQAILNALREKQAVNDDAVRQEIEHKLTAARKIVDEFNNLPVYDTRNPQEIIDDLWKE